MRHRSDRHRDRGYSLIELTLVLTLLAMFAAIANKLFMECFVVQREATKAGTQLVHTDSLVRLIRADVWGAAEIRSDAPDGVTLRMPDGSEVRWTLVVNLLEEDEVESVAVRSETEFGVEIPGDPIFAPADLAFRVEGDDLYLTEGSDTVRLSSFHGMLGRAGS